MKFKVRFISRTVSLTNQNTSNKGSKKLSSVSFKGGRLSSEIGRNLSRFVSKKRGLDVAFLPIFWFFYAFCSVQWLRNPLITCLRPDFSVPYFISFKELRNELPSSESIHFASTIVSLFTFQDRLRVCGVIFR